MKNFCDALDECGLMDQGFVGNQFTWFKNYPNGTYVWERLDRAMGTTDWFSLFPATKVIPLECGFLFDPRNVGDLNKYGLKRGATMRQ